MGLSVSFLPGFPQLDCSFLSGHPFPSTQLFTHTHTVIEQESELGDKKAKASGLLQHSALPPPYRHLSTRDPFLSPAGGGGMLSALPPSQPGCEADADEMIFREKAFVNSQAPAGRLRD